VMRIMSVVGRSQTHVKMASVSNRSSPRRGQTFQIRGHVVDEAR
jgi:hypothetical protein